MYPFLLYNLKAAGCLVVFYLFYKLLLSRETFHRLNRAVLLGGIALCFVLPLCVITVERELPVLEMSGIEMLSEVATEPVAQSFPWELLWGGLFAAGIAVAAAWTFVQVARTVRIIRRGRRERLADGTVLSRCAGVQSPFSWGRWIVISDADYAECGEQILIHEQAHIHCGHSFDLLVGDLLGCLQWFNPAMWLLRAELRMIHEYEADAAVLAAGSDAKQYQLLLIKKAVGGRWYSVANSLNHSKLKNRITMMLRKKSSRWARVRMLFVLPLVCTALGAFARTAYVFPEDKGMKKNQMVETVHVSVSNGDESRITVNGIIIDSLRTPQILVDGQPVDSMDGFDAGRISHVSVIKGDEAEVQQQIDTIPARRKMTSKIVMTKVSGNSDVSRSPEDGAIVMESNFDSSGAVSVRGFRDTTKTRVNVSGLGRDVLIIIDGVEQFGGEAALKNISPEQIESISVLKDKSAIATYGNRAANGVILVITKSAAALKHEQEAKAASEENSSYWQLATGAGSALVNHTEPGLLVSKGRVTIHNPETIPDDYLIFINGKRATKADVKQIEPLKIKRMEVLGGDDALKKYGEAGAHGVIEIKTRR